MFTPKHTTIVGAGPAGIATALALLQAGHQVTLIEKTNFDTPRVGEHLGAEANLILQQLKIDQTTWAQHHLQCAEVRSIWGDAEVYENASIFNPYGEGWVLSRPDFDQQLATQAQTKGANLLTQTSLTQLKKQANGWQLTLKQPQGQISLTTDFVVDATGRSTTVAKLLGKQPLNYDKLVGVVGFVPSQVASKFTHLLIETCPDGWWYSAQLHNGQLVATYMTDADLLANTKQSPAQFWQRQLAASTQTLARLGNVPPTQVYVKTAQSRLLNQLVGEGWLAVGDAAMSYDPLSSQGIYKGLFWGKQAAQAIAQYLANPIDTSPLLSYEQQAKNTFKEYQRLKTHYYRQEQRWQTQPFWQRRHHLLPSEVAIKLHPATMVCLSNAHNPAQAQATLQEKLPPINFSQLATLAQAPLPAHQLVQHYKTHAKVDAHLDQAIVVAIQYMLEAGFLVRAEATMADTP